MIYKCYIQTTATNLDAIKETRKASDNTIMEQYGLELLTGYRVKDTARGSPNKAQDTPFTVYIAETHAAIHDRRTRNGKSAGFTMVHVFDPLTKQMRVRGRTASASLCGDGGHAYRSVNAVPAARCLIVEISTSIFMGGTTKRNPRRWAAATEVANISCAARRSCGATRLIKDWLVALRADVAAGRRERTARPRPIRCRLRLHLRHLRCRLRHLRCRLRLHLRHRLRLWWLPFHTAP